MAGSDPLAARRNLCSCSSRDEESAPVSVIGPPTPIIDAGSPGSTSAVSAWSHNRLAVVSTRFCSQGAPCRQQDSAAGLFLSSQPKTCLKSGKERLFGQRLGD